MRRAHMTLLPIAGLAACALLVGCGGNGDKGGGSVQMKDMEVVDGTATDAMTDLDGVQSEGTATVLPASNAVSNASAAPVRPAERAPAGDDEVLADQ